MGQNKIEDIGPVEERKWFDGFLQLGDSITQVAQKEQAKASDWIGAAAKTILGTNTDILTNLVSGVVGWGEDVVDAGASLAGMLTETFGWDRATQNIMDFVKKDLYDEREITRNLFKTGALTNAFAATNPGLAFAIPTMFTIEEWLNPTKSVDDGFGGIENIKDDNSVLGETSKGILQSTGETLAKQGIQATTGIPVGDIITGVTVFGSQAEQALKEDANFMQAGGSGLISAAAEIMFEKLSGGIKISGHTLDERLTKLMSRSISNVALRNFLNFAKDIGGEAIEEAATEFVGKLGTLLYKDRDQWDEILFSKDALVDYIQSAISGGLMGGAFNAANAVNSTKKGVDYKSGLTNDEQKVVDKVTENAIKQKETDGKKLSAKEKNLLYNDILKQLEDGDISITDIEDALGEEVFKDYADTIKYEEDILKQYEELGKKKNYTLAEASLFEELKSQKKDIEQNSPREELKKQMSEKVFERVKDSKLMSSYANEARRGETFKADVNEYDEAERATIQSAIDAGFLNNTNKTRRFVNWVAKIAAKTGIKVDFTTNEKLKQSGFAVDGKFVNGYKTKDGIGINMQSKNILETVVGHEITHVLEGTELYNEMQKILFDYADSKGELETRRKAMKELYKGMKADINSELTAELVGDYLFTDQDFINRLANDNRNLFQKIWDEVKYMWKQAHPSSPEAQKLEKLKRAFEEAYKASESETTTNQETKYSLVEIVGESGTNYGIGVYLDSTLLTDLTEDERVQMVKEYVKELGGKVFTAYDGDNNAVDVHIVESNRKFKNKSGKRVPVNKDLSNKQIKFKTKQEAIALVDELITTAKYENSLPSLYSHDWVDNYGKNNWEYWKTYIQDKENTIWEAKLNIATTADGEKILYDINPIKKVEQSITLDTSTTKPIIPQKSDLSSGSAKNSAENDISVSDGTQLSLSTDTEIRKQEQFTIIQETNPAPNSYNTWIRSVNDIKTLAETLQDSDYEGYDDFNPDLTRADIDKAIESGKITVYSSYPIKNGAFVTPSKMEAQSYSGNGQVYQKTVNIDDVAWIDPTQGQYAEVKGTQFSLSDKNIKDESTGYAYGESYYTMSYTQDDKVVGTLEYGEYDGEPNVKMIEVEPEYRRKGIATKLMQELQKKYPDAQIDFGMSTPDGTKLLDAITYNVTDEAVVAERQKLKTLQTELDDLQGKLDTLFELIDNGKDLTKAHYTELHELGDRWQETYETIRELEKSLRGKRATKTFVKTDAKYFISDSNGKELTEGEGTRSQDVMVEDDATRMESTADAIAQKEYAKKASERIVRAQLHKNIIDRFKSELESKGYNLDEVLKNAKNLSTIATVDNTPQRVFEKALGRKEGGALADLTVNKIAQNETEGIKWLNSYTDRKSGVLAKISNEYKIKPGSKESAAAMMYAEGFYANDKGDLIKYGDEELAKDFPDATTQENIKCLANDKRIRQIYDETLAAINESRVRNGYPEIPRRDNYFLHFMAMEDTFSKIGIPFNPNDIRAKDLPTDINGMTADLKPGQPFFASSMQRKGNRTTYDLLGGLERYLSSAKNQIYHIDDIQNLRALRNYIADSYGRAKGLEGIDHLSEEEVQERIEKVFDSHLSTFAKFLNEEANVIAGKTSLIDRGLEGIIGRRGITFLDNVNKQYGSNAVGFNVSSSLTNTLAGVQAFAKMNKKAFVQGFSEYVSNKFKSLKGEGDTFAEESPVVVRRKGAERFSRTPFQKISDAGYFLMGAVDNATTEVIARAKFIELTDKGMDAEKAHIETDKWVSRLMGDRSLGQLPQLYNSKLLGLVTKFQLEVRNQLDSQIYDTIQEAKESTENIENQQERNAKTAAKIAATFASLAISQHVFGQVFESIAGYNPALDIISVLATLFGFDDEEDSEDTFLDNVEQGFLELLEDLPYTSVLLDGGRIPMSSALPIGQIIKGTDEYGNEKPRWETFLEALPYYIAPTGYGQAKKTVKGLSMYSPDHPVAGSYTDSGNLRFPVEEDLASVAQAAVFGQWANKNAQKYLEDDIAPINENKIQEYVDSGLTVEEYWDYREGLKKFSTKEQKVKYIKGLDIEEWQKSVLISYLNKSNSSTPQKTISSSQYDKAMELLDDFNNRFGNN